MAMTFKIYIVYSERWNHIGNMVHGSMTDLGWNNKTDYKRKFTLLFSQIISIKECTLKSTPDRQCEFVIRKLSERWDFVFIGPV